MIDLLLSNKKGSYDDGLDKHRWWKRNSYFANPYKDHFVHVYSIGMVETTEDYFWLPHEHKNNEITFVQSGSVFILANNSSNILNNKESIFIEEDCPHSLYILDKTEPLLYNFGFKFIGEPQSQTEQTIFDTLNTMDSKKKFYDSNNSMLILNCIVEFLKKNADSKEFSSEKLNEPSKMLLQSLIYSFLLSYVDDINTPDTSSSDEKFCEAVKEYIILNCNKTLYVSDIAKTFSVSESSLSKKFKKYTNISVAKYIVIKRLEVAKDLLLTTDKTVTEIAISLGFDDTHYFFNLFKKYYKITPNEYRSRANKPH